MIEYIRGIVDELAPTQGVLEAAGVGYALGISLNTYTAIQGKQQVRLFVYEYIREDAWQLYGFATRAERELFMLLINVQGIGCQTARMILSAFTPADLAGIVQAEDVRTQVCQRHRPQGCRAHRDGPEGQDDVVHGRKQHGRWWLCQHDCCSRYGRRGCAGTDCSRFFAGSGTKGGDAVGQGTARAASGATDQAGLENAMSLAPVFFIV